MISSVLLNSKNARDNEVQSVLDLLPESRRIRGGIFIEDRFYAVFLNKENRESSCKSEQ